MVNSELIYQNCNIVSSWKALFSELFATAILESLKNNKLAIALFLWAEMKPTTYGALAIFWYFPNVTAKIALQKRRNLHFRRTINRSVRSLWRQLGVLVVCREASSSNGQSEGQTAIFFSSRLRSINGDREAATREQQLGKIPCSTSLMVASSDLWQIGPPDGPASNSLSRFDWLLEKTTFELIAI